ncbi:DMT family transporter [Zongyangia hominis]|uniref:EamA family transporter n=1 Tax=Zongyangia hominis TaxID=2763677 RepID=A0A926EGA3_9FIRM|nr:DMT family transporter [Zongyangia hominis]MBC8571152.1 EamA family transporter [Zongyangia hominis]
MPTLSQTAPNKQLSPGKATVLLVICAAMWSFNGTWIKLVDFHPIVTNSARCIFTALTLYLYSRYKKEKIAVNKETIIGGLIMTSMMVVSACAFRMTTAANAIILQYVSPIYVLIVSVLFFKQKARLKDILVVVFSILGVALFFIDKVEAGNLWGNILAVFLGMLFALSFLYNNHTTQNPLHIIFFACIFSALVGIPFYFVYPPHFTPASGTAIVAMGVVNLGIPYILYSMSIQRCSALTASIATMVEPILTPVWALLLVKEKPGQFALYGAVLVLLTISLYSISNARAAQKAKAPAPENAG